MKTIYLFLLLSVCSSVFGQGKRVKEFAKGDVRLALKLPYFNHLSLQPERRFKESRFGFLGEGLGIEYNYTQDKYVEIHFAFAATSSIPFPAPVDKEYNKHLWTLYAGLTDNYIKGRFTLGYGVHYAANHWVEWVRDLSTMTTITRTEYSNKSIGFTVNTFYRLGKTANVGAMYRPSLLRIDKNPGLLYEHLISIEFMWRFRLFTIKGMKKER